MTREICQLTSNIAAATARWLLLLAEFDRRDGWAIWGARSCAEWLSWRCGIGKVAAHEHLRVAHRLGELPVVRAAFAAGDLSYSKVRAISRVATAETEENLVELARHATANHMEQIARAYRGVKRQIAKDKNGQDPKEDRYIHWYWDDDGYLVIAGRFPPEEGAILIEALNAARAGLAGDADKDQPAGDDSAESRTSSAAATEGSAEATVPGDSAESRWETAEDDSADEVGGHEVALAVGVAVVGGEEDAQPVTDRDAGRHDEEPVGEPGVSGAERLVGRLPGDQHGHHDRLSRAGGHLQPHPGQALVVRAVLGVDADAEVGLCPPAGGLGQVDRRLGRLPLAEQHPVLAGGVGPVAEQFAAHRSDAGIAEAAPPVYPGPDVVDGGVDLSAFPGHVEVEGVLLGRLG